MEGGVKNSENLQTSEMNGPFALQLFDLTHRRSFYSFVALINLKEL